MTYEIKLVAFEREGKIMFRAEAEQKEKDVGQSLFWEEDEYLEDALHKLGKLLRKKFGEKK